MFKSIATNLLATVTLTLLIYFTFFHDMSSSTNDDSMLENDVRLIEGKDQPKQNQGEDVPKPRKERPKKHPREDLSKLIKEPTTTTKPKEKPVQKFVRDSYQTPVKTVQQTRTYTRPSNPEAKDGVWQKVKEDNVSRDIYLYSAYFDDRDTIEHPTIRVIGIIESKPQELYCLLWYNHSATPDVVSAERTKAGEPEEFKGKKFQGEIFSCGLPEKKYCPSHISILRHLKFEPSNILKVNTPKKPIVEIDFGVCLGVAYGDIDVYMLIEWLEILKLWGVGEITMYNNSISNQSSYILADYVMHQDVVVYPAPSVFDVEGVDIIRLTLSPVLNDCMYRNLYRYQALIATELGELIVPKTGTNYFEMLTDIQRVQPSRHPATTYVVRNAFFYMDLPVLNIDSYLVTQKYLYGVTPDVYGHNSRSIVGPRSCVVLGSLSCIKVVPKYDVKGWVIDVNPLFALNHNYRYCDLDVVLNDPGQCANKTSSIHRDETMMDFNDDLTTKTAEVLFKLNMESGILGEMDMSPLNQSQVPGNVANNGMPPMGGPGGNVGPGMPEGPISDQSGQSGPSYQVGAHPQPNTFGNMAGRAQFENDKYSSEPGRNSIKHVAVEGVGDAKQRSSGNLAGANDESSDAGGANIVAKSQMLSALEQITGNRGYGNVDIHKKANVQDIINGNYYAKSKTMFSSQAGSNTDAKEVIGGTLNQNIADNPAMNDKNMGVNNLGPSDIKALQEKLALALARVGKMSGAAPTHRMIGRGTHAMQSRGEGQAQTSVNGARTSSGSALNGNMPVLPQHVSQFDNRNIAVQRADMPVNAQRETFKGSNKHINEVSSNWGMKVKGQQSMELKAIGGRHPVKDTINPGLVHPPSAPDTKSHASSQ